MRSALAAGIALAATVAVGSADKADVPAPRADAPAGGKDEAKGKDEGVGGIAGAAKKAAQEAPAREPLEMRPYKIRAWIWIDPRARLDSRGREALIDAWKVLAQRFVGPPWALEVADGLGPFGGGDLQAVKADEVARATEGCDKGWMIRVEPQGAGYVFSGREYDLRTGRMGQPYRRVGPWPADAPRALFQLALDMFSATAEIGKQSGGGVTIRVQGAGLPAADPIGQVVTKGSVFRPLRVVLKSDKKTVIRVQEINFTFLRVEQVDGADAFCSIVSGLRNALATKMRGGVAVLVAVGVKPANNPSRFKFVEIGSNNIPKPAAGYVLTAKPHPKGTPREVGTTDREGRIVLAPDFADSLVIMQLLAGNVEPLVQFPWMPGETAEERLVKVVPRPEAVALETEVNAIRDEVFDLVGKRARLIKRLKDRIAGENPNWEEAKAILKEFHTLPPRKVFEDRLNKLKDQANARQAENKRLKILTSSAQAQMNAALNIIDRYLVDDEIEPLEETVQAQGKGARPGTAPTPAPAAATGAGAGAASGP